MKITSCIAGVLLLMAASVVAYADFPVRMVGAKAWLPAVAYNSTDHEYLVVWSEEVNTGTIVLNYVFGQRVSEAGAMLGSPFVVFTYGFDPVVAYNSLAHEYLVGFNPGGGYVGQRVSSTGTPVGDPSQLIDGMGYGRLMYNSLTGQYLFVGADVRETFADGSYTMKIWSRKIGADGVATNAPVFVDSLRFGANTPPDGKFSAAFAPIQSAETPQGRFLLALSAHGSIILEFLNSDGVPIDVVSDPSHPGVHYREVPFETGSVLGGLYNVDVAYGDASSYSMTGPAFLIVWADQNNTWGSQSWTGIWGSFLDATKIAYLTTDIVQDNAFPISAIADHWTRDPEIETYRPRVAYNASSQKFYVVWREMPGTSPYNNATVNHIRGSYVFESVPAHNVVISATNGTEDPHRPALAASTSSEHALVVWQDYRNGVSNIYGNVEKVADAVIPPPLTGLHLVTNTLDGGPGSLRQAILDANTHDGKDTIAFNIPGSVVHTIMPVTPLPRLSGPVLIDGYTQPGSSPNTKPLKEPDDAVLAIVLDGSGIVEPSGQLAGLRLYGGNSTVRGLVIGSFAWGGIFVDSSDGNVIGGNFIGTDNLGLTSRGNLHGVQVGRLGSVTIGGSTAAARNIISGNTQTGAFVFGTHSSIQGNYIGLSADGTKAIANTDAGVVIWGDSVLIGGSGEGQGNVISGNGADGIFFNPQQSCVGWVQGNVIGAAADGASPLGNGQFGIALNSGCLGVMVGGSSSGAGNIIAYNTSDGIKVAGSALTQPPRGNRISRNSIFKNGGLGINLGGGWEVKEVTGNDYQDKDTGPNNLQNFPVITSAEGGDYASVVGSLNSTPSTSFTIEFFATSPACVSAGRDGQTYLGDAFLTTDTAGNVSFNTTIGTPVGVGQSITATATDNDGNTSEFSAPIIVTLAPPPGTEVVTNCADSGPGSLRQAILNVNAKNAGDTIAFNIPGTDVQTIQPTSPLPEITSRVILDGYTQPGSSVNTNVFGDGSNAALKIVLDGSLAGNAASALRVKGGGSVVRGLVINNFKTTTGVEISGSGGCRVEGCFVGTDVTGSQTAENLNGVLIAGSGSNTIGGTNATQRNVISGSTYVGVYVENGASGNSIVGNYIGLNASGKNALGKTQIGVFIQDASGNNIGGAAAGAGNAIGGCVSLSGVGVAIWINGTGSRHNVVMGNLVGLNASGNDTVHNNSAGLYIDGSANTVGGSAPGTRNTISGQQFGGVVVNGDTNLIQGNYVGSDITGTEALGNRGSGLTVTGLGNMIGGSALGAGNLVSGNSGCAISLSGTMGSVTPHEARFNRIEGNRIGTQADGASPLGNAGVGILFGSSAFENAIGDSLEGAGNIIAFNDSGGVVIQRVDPKSNGASSTNNRILHNSIFGNGCLGIDLCGGAENDAGVTANDPGDSDEGPNHLQNSPELSAVQGGSALAVHGTLNSTPNAAFYIEFFATPVTGTTIPGEGQTYLGWTRVFTDASGNAPISTTIAVPVALGRAITATATDSLGNTSEFSAAIVVTTTGISPGSGLPRETALIQNFPNPFNPTTTIRYTLTQRSEVTLAVFNVLGQEIVTLVDGSEGPGYHEVQFDGRSLSSGIYLYRLKAGNYTKTMTFVLLK